MILLINKIIYHQNIKIKPIDFKPDCYTECSVESNEKTPNFKVGDHVRLSKYKNIFAKGHVPNWSEESLAISKIKQTVPWTYVIRLW